MIPKVTLPADFGIENLYSSTHGNVTVNQQGRTTRQANSMIMSLNSAVFRHMFLDLELCSVDMEDFSVEAVNVFLEGLYCGQVKLDKTLFREIVKMAHVFKVSWMTANCKQFFVDLVESVSDVDFAEMLYIFEEARYIKDATKETEYIKMIIGKITTIANKNPMFVERYMENYLDLSTEQLDLMIQTSIQNGQILIKIMKHNIEKQGFIFDKNSKYLLENLDLVSCMEQNAKLLEELFDMLSEKVADISVDDMRMIMQLSRNTAREFRVIKQSRLDNNGGNGETTTGVVNGLNVTTFSLHSTSGNVSEAQSAATKDKKQATLVGACANMGGLKKIPVKVSGPNSEEVKPMLTFEDVIQPQLGTNKEKATKQQILQNINEAGYTEPSPLQQVLLPVVLTGKDSITVGGSGKVVAFLVPMILREPSVSAVGLPQKPAVVVLAPTRELANEIYNVMCTITHQTSWKARLACGVEPHERGVINRSCKQERRLIEQGCNIVVGTPSQVLCLIREHAITMEEGNTKLLVMYEADWLLETPQSQMIVDFITGQNTGCGQSHFLLETSYQTLLISDKFPEEVQRIGKQFLKPDYLFVAVGGETKSVTQILENSWDMVRKTDRLSEILRENGKNGKTLIFVRTNIKAETISLALSQTGGLNSTFIHAGLSHAQSGEALRSFKAGEKTTLVATAAVMRGLNIAGITHVINYNLPDDMAGYERSIGMAGNAGTAVSFFNTDKDIGLARGLFKKLVAAKQEVPAWLEELQEWLQEWGGVEGLER